MDLEIARRVVRRPLSPLGAGGGVVILLGAWMMARGQVETAFFIRVFPSLSPIICGAPAIFVLAGLGMIAVACGRKFAATAAGSACALLGSLGLVAEQSHPGAEPPGETMALAAAFCLGLAGAALLATAFGAQRRRPIVPAVLGAIIAALPAAVLLSGMGKIAPAGHGPLTAAQGTASGFLVIGAGFLAAAVRLRKTKADGARLAPVLAGACILSGSVYFALGLRAFEEFNVDWGTELAAAHLARDVAAGVGARTDAVERLARLWETRERPGEGWESDARLHLSHLAGHAGIAWWDASFEPRWTLEPVEAEGFDWKSRAKPLATSLAACRDHRALTLSGWLDIPGGKAFAVCAPTDRENAFQGAAVGIFRLGALLDSILASGDLDGYSVEVLNRGDRLYQHVEPAPGPNAWAKVLPVHVQGMVWTLRVSPGERPVARQRSGLPTTVLLLGSVLACLTALAVHLAQMASLRARQTESVNRELQRQIAERKLAEDALAKARDELEHRVAERTAELARANQDLRAEIAERKCFEETLRASEQRYRELFDNANDLIYVHDLDGNFLAINKAARRITGYTQGEALALNLERLVAPEDVDLARGMIARQLAGEPVSTYEVGAFTKTGTRLALELSTHLVFRGGNPIAIQGIARDVTERKRLEDELRHSQKLEAIGRLAGGLAHDLNNLLTVVGAYSQMISDEAKGSPQLKCYAEEILAAAERAGALTARLLAFSRRQMLQPRLLNLNQLVLSMDNMLRRLIGEDIELVIIPESDIGAMKADPGQVEQVIMNLAVNARDAMPRGGRLTLQTANVEFAQPAPGGPPPGRYVKLTVSDDGVGMSADVLSHIFEPFFTTKGPGKGTGLGLSTVYGIVKQSGGEVTVESEPGKGSTFSIYFQRSSEAAPAGAEPDAPADPGARPRERVTILLVEDEPGVRRLVRRMLVERGYRVLEAAGGEEALAIYDKQRAPVDLVLTDIVMPNMTGSELAERLRTRRPGLRVLYMSGYSEEAIFEHGVPAQSAPILKKPFLAEALDRHVRDLLESRNPAR